MNKSNRFKDFSLEQNNSNQESQKDNIGDDEIKKVLCNHCGRTAINGIRCLGICVADNEY
tara:strand:- start:771 stop:950 length:180 start_codon:yes stop_codon:yes gene_type:complete